ncbi:MAG: hypothetical protein NT094_04545, partial [Candidatus Staskawiczbacteria bacterium]|nr:hypothetical protein [Candidatus Staskawiczbacteria bacterium]
MKAVVFLLLGILLLTPLCITVGVRIVNGVVFDRGCKGHLKRAADSNTVALATKEMETAVVWVEQNGMTSGYTSVLYTTPNEDVGFWYENLRSALEELQKVNPEASQLERTNVLMKLRETLLDKDDVTVPPGISVFPHNTLLALLMVISII